MEKIQQLVPDQKTAKMILADIPAGLVIQNDKQFFYELNEAELIQVKLKETTKIESRVLKKVNSTICTIALFNDNREKIKQHCHYTIILDDLKSGIFWMSGNKFVITAQESYRIKCNDSEKTAICETQCVLFLDPGCSIETETEWVPEIFGNGTDAIRKYTVSANLLSHFFDSSDLALISGSSLFTDLPEIDISHKFQIFQPNLTFIAEDRKIALNMQKSIDQIKKSDIAVHGLADSIILGNHEIQTSQWTNSLGFCLMALMLISLFLMAQIVYLSLKVKFLLLKVAVLQQAYGAAAQMVEPGITEQPRLRLGFYSSTERANQINDIHVQIVQNMSSYWFWLVISALGLIIIGIIVRSIFRKYFRQLREIKIRTQLAFLFSGFNGRHVVISVQEISALVGDLIIVSNSLPTDFQVNGCFLKDLTFSWPANIRDNFSGEVYEVPQTVRIKLYEAYMVRCLLDSRFTVKPVFLQGKKVVKAKIIAGAISRTNTPVSGRKSFKPSAPPRSMIIPNEPEIIELQDASDFV